MGSGIRWCSTLLSQEFLICLESRHFYQVKLMMTEKKNPSNYILASCLMHVPERLQINLVMACQASARINSLEKKGGVFVM